jgi:cyclophilin family peptidyl-prolyl cis-trans isomerase
MFKQLRKWCGSLFPQTQAAATPCAFEQLENRQLLSAAISGIYADNRGLVQLGVTQDLKATTVNAKTVQVLVGGQDGKLGTSDDVVKKASVKYSTENDTITISAKLPANVLYRVRLIGSKIKGLDGKALDGEFKGANRPSGNGTPGGNFDISTKTARTPVARFYTSEGIMDVTLFKSQVAKTVDNFIHYANEGVWDKTFFHRKTTMLDAGLAVIQGGGYFITSNDTIDRVPQDRRSVKLQDTLSNTRGTISMARTADPNSGSVEWFFNTEDNSGVLDHGKQGSPTSPGYAVFGRTNAKGLVTMDAIAAHDKVDAWGDTHIDPVSNGQPIRYDTAFTDLPVKNAALFNSRTVNNVPHFDPNVDAIKITRVAIKMAVAATRA